MRIERSEPNEKKTIRSRNETFSMLKSMCFFIRNPDLISQDWTLSLSVLPACIIGAGAACQMLQGSARTSFPVQSSHTDTKAKEAHSPPCAQHLLHVAVSPPRSCLSSPVAIGRERRADFRKTPKNYSEIVGFVLVSKHLRVHVQLVFERAWMSRGYLLHIHASHPHLPCATRHCKQRLLSAGTRWQPNEHIGIMLSVMNR